MNTGIQTDILDKITAFLSREHSHLINGKIAVSSGTKKLSILDPSNGKEIAQTPIADKNDVEAAVNSAHIAFKDGRWSGLRPADRERILLKFADLVERDADLIAHIETLEQGKSIMISRHVEVGGSIEFIRFAAGLATKLYGRTMDLSPPPGMKFTAFTRREPIGVVAAIAPWNFPMAIALWKVIPALAAGCTVVLKPSESTPLTALWLAELALEAGVPDGVFNVITGDGATSGDALVRSPLVSKISFTGSTVTGKSIGKIAMDRMARVTLELGGKNPAIILKDADIDAAVQGIVMGAFLNNGQVCAAASRIYIESEVFDKFAAAMEGVIKGMSVGPGLDPSNQINPLVSQTHQNRVQNYLDDASSKGAELISGKDGPDKNGFYISPTLVINPNTNLNLFREEVFGPLLGLTRVANAQEAISKANDTQYGLAASLWTSDLKATMDIVPQLEAGTVWVNTHVPLDANMPFGGYKQSGIGREFGPNWVENFTEEKSVCISH